MINTIKQAGDYLVQGTYRYIVQPITNGVTRVAQACLAAFRKVLSFFKIKPFHVTRPQCPGNTIHPGVGIATHLRTLGITPTGSRYQCEVNGRQFTFTMEDVLAPLSEADDIALFHNYFSIAPVANNRFNERETINSSHMFYKRTDTKVLCDTPAKYQALKALIREKHSSLLPRLERWENTIRAVKRLYMTHGIAEEVLDSLDQFSRILNRPLAYGDRRPYDEFGARIQQLFETNEVCERHQATLGTNLLWNSVIKNSSFFNELQTIAPVQFLPRFSEDRVSLAILWLRISRNETINEEERLCVNDTAPFVFKRWIFTGCSLLPSAHNIV